MRSALFDLETNGLLPDLHTVWCGVVYDLDTNEVFEYGPHEIPALIEKIKEYDVLCGHNLCGFDMIVLEMLYGYDFTQHIYLDTLAMSRCIFPGSMFTTPLRLMDIIFTKKHGPQTGLVSKHHGRHTLKAWSIRLQLGDQGKRDYDGGFEKWTPELQEYCRYDVLANVALLRHFLKKGWNEKIFHVESEMTYWMQKQEMFGIRFNEEEAQDLHVQLSGTRSELECQLAATFPPMMVPNGKPKIAKADRTCRKYKEGEPGWFPPRIKGEAYQLWKEQEFNPGSGPQTVMRLGALYDWEPQSFTDNGRAKVTDDILRDLPWPEAQQIADYLVATRILGYLYEGKQAWLGLVKDGRIHGRVMTTGATTTRAAHTSPNLAQVPSVNKPHGKECRACFLPDEGQVLVGCDADSLQLAIYAHYVARHDGGKLASLCEDPDGDPHEYMRAASGLFYRHTQKNLTYATFFGAGVYKQGLLAITDWTEALKNGLTPKPVPHLKDAGKLGAEINGRMLARMPGFREIGKDCDKAAARGKVTLLDGHPLKIEQSRMALVTLLQGNEAVVMKRAYLLAVKALGNLITLRRATPVLWVHDEFQWTCDADHADDVGKTLSECITQAGDDLGLSLKLTASYKVGSSWEATH
jgi:hypothetical protein